MLRKKLKAFTLVECLVSIAVLGVGSLTMAQVFSAVGKMNVENHTVNESLSRQMSYVEQYTNNDSDTIRVDIFANEDASGKSSPVVIDSATKKPPHIDTATGYANVKITKKNADGTDGDSYSYPVDMFVLVSRKTDDSEYSATEEDPFNLRYKYILGHQN